MKKLTYLLIIIILAPMGCSKKDENDFIPTLPPITQTGENTFGCYINGVLVTPRDGTGTFGGPDKGILFTMGPGPTIFNYNDLNVHDFASERTGRINIRIKNLDSIGVGEYIINESSCSQVDSPSNNNIFCRVFDPVEGIYKTYCSYENSGLLIITKFDVENRIISGIFNGKVRNKENINDVVDITEGRFDLNRNTVNSNVYP